MVLDNRQWAGRIRRSTLRDRLPIKFKFKERVVSRGARMQSCRLDTNTFVKTAQA
jgi:hypothetical protein